ncbi:sensor histidine kinase [Rhodopseudomonas sp.]|uniref:sensor histidine kinase n=1 Tax=Rhodopseudomonas sp. TaxID=1078 RepID=UPI003B3B6107
MSVSDPHSVVQPVAADQPGSLMQRVARLMQRIGLRFADPADELRFVETFVRGSLRWTQAAMLLGAATYAGYTFWDWVLYPEVVPTTLAIRGGTALLVLLPLTVLIAFARSWTEPILLLYCVIPGCVLPFVYLVLPSGFTFASAGMIIVILFVSTMLPLRVGSLLVFCVTTWLAFAFVEWIAPSLPTGLGFINHFLIGNAYLLSLYAVGAREYRARRLFETTEALRLETARAETSLQALQATQAHLVQAEKLASLGQLVAGVAHEVSTPLGLALTASTTMQGDVKGLSQMVESGQVRRSELVRGMGRLEQGLQLTWQSLHRASEMIHTFKQVAVDHANEQQDTFELQGWLAETFDKLKPLLARRGLAVEVSAPPGIMLHSYPGALGQLMSILAFNAAEHGYPDGAGGVFTVTATQPDPATLRIVCADRGVGIAPELRDRIFDPFFTTRRDSGNAGLGLHIAFNLVVSTLGGTIELIEQDSGAAFAIEIPTQRPGT